LLHPVLPTGVRPARGPGRREETASTAQRGTGGALGVCAEKGWV